MHGNVFSPAYMFSNGVSLLILVLAIWRPVLARTLLSILFTGAAFFNAYTVLAHPQLYLEYADTAALPVYEQFIRQVFSLHVTNYVLLIATGQLLIGTCMAGRGLLSRGALLGAIIFLVSIAPLGAAAAFPSTVVLGGACEILFIKGQPATLPAIYRRKATLKIK